MKTRNIPRLFLWLSCLATLLAPAAHALKYSLADLGTIPTLAQGSYYAMGISPTGEVIGTTPPLTDTRWHSFVYRGGRMQDLGFLQSTDTTRAYSINAKGNIVGNFGYQSPSPQSPFFGHAFLNKDFFPQDIGLVFNSKYSTAYGINDSDVVVGEVSTANGTRGFVYSKGIGETIGTLPGGDKPFSQGSRVYAISNDGRKVGSSDSSNGVHAVLITDLWLFSNAIFDLGTLGGNYSTAYSIDNKGDKIVGVSRTSQNVLHAFLYSGGKMQDLGNLPGRNESIAYSVNSNGYIVGMSAPSISSATLKVTTNSRAFLYTGSTGMVDLNTITATNGWILLSATGVDMYGQIAVTGKHPTLGTHALLLTPVPEGSPALSFSANSSTLTIEAQNFTPKGTATVTVSNKGGSTVFLQEQTKILPNGSFSLSRSPSGIPCGTKLKATVLDNTTNLGIERLCCCL